MESGQDNPVVSTESATHTGEDWDFQSKLSDYFVAGIGSTYQKLSAFTKYVPRQILTSFLARTEMFQKALPVQGSVVECGVYLGAGIMTWSQLSAILEPVNFQRQIIGFDTFNGFPDLSEEDKVGTSEFLRPGGLAADSYEDILKCIELYDSNRFLNHLPKVQVVKGDATQTIPKFIRDNPHLIVSLLNLDFDLYEPTKVAIENFLPRMPKGAVIVFDELNDKLVSGSTTAVVNALNLSDLRIQRISYEPRISYAVLE